MMNAELIRVVCILGPIVGLFAMGLSLTLRSGVARVGTPEGARLVAANLSKTIMVVALCLLGVALMQPFVGYRMGPVW